MHKDTMPGATYVTVWDHFRRSWWSE